MSDNKNLVAVDMGFRRVKFVDNNGTIPGQFDHAVAPRSRETFVMERPTYDDIFITLPNGREWAVGKTAYRHSANPVGRLDPQWVLSEEYEVLLCAAFSQMFIGVQEASVVLATGLPVEHYMWQERLRRQRLLGEHTFTRNGGDPQRITVTGCVVAVQALGALLNHALDAYGYVSRERIPGTNKPWATATVGVIDGGGNTVNFSAFEGLRELGHRTQGANLGIMGPIARIRQEIVHEYPRLSPTLAEVANWLEQGYFSYLGSTVTVDHYAAPVLKEHADLVWNQAMAVWPSIGNLDAILLTGGQAYALAQYMPETMNGEHDLLVISKDPVYDNVRGFLKLLYHQMRQEAAQ